MCNLYDICADIHFVPDDRLVCITLLHNYKALPARIGDDVKSVSVDICDYFENARYGFVSLKDAINGALIINTKEVSYISCFYRLIKENDEDSVKTQCN